uniref:uncharacterized protein isoform X1 n=2 Tax=Myxine glutinosa TaxID=7769 RepID=UPI00358F8D0E
MHVEGQIDSPSMESPSWWIWLIMAFGLVLFSAFIFVISRFYPQVGAWFNVSKILRCFYQNSTQPTINGDQDAIEPFLGKYAQVGCEKDSCHVQLELEQQTVLACGMKVEEPEAFPEILHTRCLAEDQTDHPNANEGTARQESQSAEEYNFFSEDLSFGRRASSWGFERKINPRRQIHSLSWSNDRMVYDQMVRQRLRDKMKELKKL